MKKYTALAILIAVILIVIMQQEREQQEETEEPPIAPVSAAVKIEPIQAEPIKEPEEEKTEYLVPLEEELKEYTIATCNEYGIPPEIAFSIMWNEARYKSDAISSTNDYGLMQINKVNHGWLAEEYGLDDMLNPYQNIKAGVMIFATAYNKYNDPHLALMAYNMGDAGAGKLWNKGTTATKYSQKVMDKAAEIVSTNKPCKEVGE
jgi:soluble lytic murein transglycosylase-like protein